MQLALLYVKQLKNMNYENSRIELLRLDGRLLRIKLQERSVTENRLQKRRQKYGKSQGANKRATQVAKQK